MAGSYEARERGGAGSQIGSHAQSGSVSSGSEEASSPWDIDARPSVHAKGARIARPRGALHVAGEGGGPDAYGRYGRGAAHYEARSAGLGPRRRIVAVVAGALAVLLVVVLLVRAVACSADGGTAGSAAGGGSTDEAVSSAQGGLGATTGDAAGEGATGDGAATDAGAAGDAAGGEGQTATTDEDPAADGAAAEVVAADATVEAAVAADYQGVEDPWLEGGVFTTGDATLDAYVKAHCDANTTEGLSATDNAYNAYLAVVWAEYVERDNDQDPQGPTWDIEYAKQFFESGNSGNCYEFAAAASFVLRYFGYSDAKADPYIVKLQSGNWGDHGLVMVTDITTGAYCLCDSSLGSNGWMLPYDSYEYQLKDIGQY